MSKILIVEDLAFTRSMVKDMLSEGGYDNILEAPDAKTAMEMFEAEKPELTLLDITLPDRKDLSLLEELLKKKLWAKIVICSAVSQPVVMTEAVKLGAVEYIIKPVEKGRLLEIVGNILNK